MANHTRSLSHRPVVHALLALLVAATAVSPVPARAAPSATLSVDTTLDEYDNTGTGTGCSLREAIISANQDEDFGGCTGAGGYGAETITFALNGVFSLSRTGPVDDAAVTGDLDITGPLTLLGNGSGNTVIDGGGFDRVVHVLGAHPVTLSGLTLRNGVVAANEGGGLYVENAASTVTLAETAIVSNTAEFGGGISSAGSLIVNASNVYSNVAQAGGGLRTTGPLTMTASGVYSNSATSLGGGVYNLNSSAFLTNVTIRHNSAPEVGGLYHGGSAPLYMVDSLVLANTATTTMDSRSGGLGLDGNVTISNTQILSNTASDVGGGINSTGSLTITGGSLIAFNRALGGFFPTAGGLQVFGTVRIDSALILSNTAGYSGGGLVSRNPSQVTITNSVIQGNSSEIGGGLVAAGGMLTLTHSLVTDNSAELGGGLHQNVATTIISNTTFSGNTSTGINNGGGGAINVSSSSISRLSHVTVTGNTAPETDGGGIRLAGGFIFIENSIVAGNLANEGNDAKLHFGTLTSQGYNLLGDATGVPNFTSPGDITNTAALLLPLADNGGPTRTHALMPASPARNAANPATCTGTDQRGVTRPQESGCDIGAFELVTGPADIETSQTAPAGPLTVAHGEPVSFTVVITNNGPYTATGVTLTDTLPPMAQFYAASGAACSGTVLLVCTINTLAPDTAVTVTVAVSPLASGVHLNSVVVAALEDDPQPGNNAATATVTIDTQWLYLPLILGGSP